MWHSKFCLLVEQGEGNSLNIESILGAAISDYSIPGGQERLRCLSVNQISCTFQLSRQPLAPWTSSELNIFNRSPEPFSTAVILSQEGSVTLFAKEIISGLVSYFLLWGGGNSLQRPCKVPFLWEPLEKKSLENSFAKWVFWIPEQQTFGFTAGYFCYFR